MDSTLSLDGETADHKKQKSLPPHITTPRRGPLLLKKLQASKSPQTELPSCLKEKKCRSQYQPQAKVLMSGVRVCIPARGCGFLTRYPVVVTPRPMDVIEDQLLKGEVTWSQLKYNVQLMTEDRHGLTAEREGYDSAESALLHHRMKYSSHSNDPLLAIERYTHSMSSANNPNSIGPDTINVSVTCSRIPQKREVVRQESDLLTLKSSFMTSVSTQIWKGSSNANPQVSREKERDCFQTPSPVNRVSDKGVYLTNGVVKTDNHGRSTSLPQQPLVQIKSLKRATMSHHIVEPSHMWQIKQPPVAHKQQNSDTMPPSTHSVMVGEEEVKPSKSLRIYLSSHDGPSIAPAGVRAVATHRLRPVTNNTMIKGMGLVTVAR